MLRLLFLLAAFLSLASVVVEARYFVGHLNLAFLMPSFKEVYRIRPFFDTPDDVAFIPQRQLRQGQSDDVVLNHGHNSTADFLPTVQKSTIIS